MSNNEEIIPEKERFIKNIEIKNIIKARKNITNFETSSFFAQIYKSRFPKIALQIYHHIKTKAFSPQ